MSRQVFRLGAEELIELGRPASPVLASRRPFLGSGPGTARPGRPFIRNRRMGDILATLGDIAGFVANFLGGALNFLADAVQVPLDLLSSGVDIVFTSVADLLGEIPFLGPIAAQIVLVGNSAIKWALSLPGEILGGLGNVLEGLGTALSSEYTAEEESELKEDAKKQLIENAPADIKDDVKTFLESSPAPGTRTTPTDGAGRADQPPAGVELEDVLKVGLPVAGGAALLAVLLS